MGLEIRSQYFTSMGEVLADVARQGTWPTTFVSGPSAGLPVHWHDHDVYAYVMEGETDFLDVESGQRLAVRQGDKVIVPARTLHAEGPVAERVVYVLAVPEPLPSRAFLAMHEPGEL
jgi:mannose-6-phosphate isomerase-like protein (cupin superfamily)